MMVKIVKLKPYLIKVLMAIIFYFRLTSLAIAQPIVNTENNRNSIVVKKIEVQGHTVFSDQEIDKVIQAYQGKELDFSELRNITKALTDLYVSKGYITSGAFLPQQEIVDGIIKVKVVEGKLEAIKIEGLKNLQTNYVRSFISSAQTAQLSEKLTEKTASLAQALPLNVNSLEAELNLLKRDPSIENIKAELVRGTEPNLSVILIKVEETAPFKTKLGFDNYRSPSVGEFQGTLETSYRNLVGISDRLLAQYNLSEGFDSYSVGYGIPLTSNKGIFNIEYRNGESKIIEDSFDEANIRAEADTISLQYRQPIIFQPEREVAFSIAFARENSETFVLDNQPFSFTDGPQKGSSVVSLLQLTGDWLERSTNSVWGVTSGFNIGLDVFNATVNKNAPDGLFFSWQTQAQWTRALNQAKNLLLVTKLTTQLTPDSLLPLEKFTLGGVGTVRGYRQNQEVGDNGVVGTVEVYLPLAGDRRNANNLNLIPFFDGGTVWNNTTNRGAETLVSLGIGLDWQFRNFLSLRADWGIPLINTSDRGDSLQDNGFSFSLQLQPF